MSGPDPGAVPQRARRRSRLIGAVVLAALVLSGFAGWHLLGPRRTPPGQPRLVHLNPGNLEVLRNAFNAASEEPRLLILASPT
jgi:hypothetical protein